MSTNSENLPNISFKPEEKDLPSGVAIDYLQYSENRGLSLLVNGKWLGYVNPTAEIRMQMFMAFSNPLHITVYVWYNETTGLISYTQFRYKK